MDAGEGRTLDGLGEQQILDELFARLGVGSGTEGSDVLVGPGDDTALLRTDGAVLATTDTMVRGRDWLDRWSGAADVGAKVVVQNLADLAAMGGVGTGVLITLVAPGDTPVAWVGGLADGIAAAAGAAGVPVLGGDLASAEGAMMVSVTALGRLVVPEPVLRSGVRAGQLLVVSEELGRSAAGLELLRRGDAGWWPPQAVAEQAASYVGYHCRPTPDLAQGPAGARAGVSAMIDVSDGLVRDGGRLAAASRVRVDLDEEAVAELARPLVRVLGDRTGLDCVLTGGEEHIMLGSCDEASVPAGWHVIGRVTEAGAGGPGVWWRGERASGGGWDHFGG